MKPLNSRAWSIGTIVVAGLVAWGVAEYTLKHDHSHDHDKDQTSLHDWLHRNLGISEEQEDVLRPIELAYETESNRCREKIETAGVALGEAIRNYPEDSEEISSARTRLHQAKGLLEEITLDHFFAMKKHLTDEQGEKLLEWTRESLLHGHRR
ncbi:MAG: periplasmic heavy metal sensor [Verrucomicrobiales bacterium]|nr:periplasmic heavy metal sensor [Verrucomicrobiales bacterium]